MEVPATNHLASSSTGAAANAKHLAAAEPPKVGKELKPAEDLMELESTHSVSSDQARGNADYIPNENPPTQETPNRGEGLDLLG